MSIEENDRKSCCKCPSASVNIRAMVEFSLAETLPGGAERGRGAPSKKARSNSRDGCRRLLALMGIDEVGTLARLKAIRRDLIDPSIAVHSGRTIKLIGDGSLVEFASVIDAVACARRNSKIDPARTIATAGRPENPVPNRHQCRRRHRRRRRYLWRRSQHRGANRGARGPWWRLLSRAARPMKCATSCRSRLESRRERSVKNIARPIEVFEHRRQKSPGPVRPPSHDAAMRGPALSMPWPPENGPRPRALSGTEAARSGRCRNILRSRRADRRGMERLRVAREGRAPRLLVILGSSGAGKSSFLRAGILPRLERTVEISCPCR